MSKKLRLREDRIRDELTELDVVVEPDVDDGEFEDEEDEELDLAPDMLFEFRLEAPEGRKASELECLPFCFELLL